MSEPSEKTRIPVADSEIEDRPEIRELRGASGSVHLESYRCPRRRGTAPRCPGPCPTCRPEDDSPIRPRPRIFGPSRQLRRRSVYCSMRGPTLSLAEASRRCSCSRDTIRRRLHAGDIAGASQDKETGEWSIPIAQLVQAGLLDRTTPADEPDTPTEVPPIAVDAELDQLRAEVITQKHRAELVEAKLDGAEKRAETAEMALRMITTGLGERTLSETPPIPSEIVVDLTDEPAEKAPSEKPSSGS